MLFQVIIYAVLFTRSLSSSNVQPFINKTTTTLDYGPLLIGAPFTFPFEFPWMARVYSEFENDPDARTACGGSLLNDRWLATAAHCVTSTALFVGTRTAWRFRARLGKYDLSQTEPGEQTRYATQRDIYIHPKFQPGGSIEYDFALVRLTKPVNFTRWIRPIDLPEQCSEVTENSTTFDGCSKATIMGWGAPGDENPSTFTLKKMDVTFRPFATCLNLGGPWNDCKICASSPEIGQQTCKGDSGSPLVCQNPKTGRFYIIGMVSYGPFFCDWSIVVTPTVYSRICGAIVWIRSVLAGFQRPFVATATLSTFEPASKGQQLALQSNPWLGCQDPVFLVTETRRSNQSQCPLETASLQTLREAFFIALRTGHLDVLKRLIDTNLVSVNEEEGYALLGYKQPALTVATRWGKAASVQFLVENGVEMNVRDSRYNRTAAIWALCENEMGIMNYLLAKGGSLKGCQCDPGTPYNQLCAANRNTVPAEPVWNQNHRNNTSTTLKPASSFIVSSKASFLKFAISIRLSVLIVFLN